MWEHPAVVGQRRHAARARRHRARARRRRARLRPHARGRLPEIDVIVEALLGALTPTRDLAGERVLVTAGPTREPIDPVRYISNRSSGRMGYALAAAAPAAGRAGHPGLGPDGARRRRPAATFVPVQTAEEMREAVLHHVEPRDASSSRPPRWPTTACGVRPSRRSRASATSRSSSRPIPTSWPRSPRRRRGAFIVGFAAETHDVVANARAKLRGQGHRPARGQRREPPRHRLRRRGQRGAAASTAGAAAARCRACRRPRSPTPSSTHILALRAAIPRARSSAERRSPARRWPTPSARWPPRCASIATSACETSGRRGRLPARRRPRRCAPRRHGCRAAALQALRGAQHDRLRLRQSRRPTSSSSARGPAPTRTRRGCRSSAAPASSSPRCSSR